MTQDFSIYIGNGFMDSQLLYVIPFVDGYAQEKGIRKLVFERPLPQAVTQHSDISKILAKYEVTSSDFSAGPWRAFPNLKRLINMAPLAWPAFLLATQTSRKGLLEQVGWFDCQMRHAVWDRALTSSRDGTLNLSLVTRMKSAILALAAARKARHLLKRNNVKAAVLGHTVYAGRGLLAELRQHNVDVIAHAGQVFHRLETNQDTSFTMMPRKDWDRLGLMVSVAQIEHFWQERKAGHSSYFDANEAAKKNKEISEKTPKNIILLHVFRDSPFNYIDRNRIFSDYVEWVSRTLKIIAKSRESWLIKSHPSAKRWGEDQEVWLEAICKKSFNGKWPANIEISYGGYSNLDLFQNATRIVTYHGTAHLEAACCGIKPIVISEVTLSSYDPTLVLKPNSLSDYEKLLCLAGEDRTFRLEEKSVDTAKKLLYIKENLMSFAKEVGSLPVYRGDHLAMYKKDLASVEGKVSLAINSLKLAGRAMAVGLPRTVRFWCLDRFKKEKIII